MPYNDFFGSGAELYSQLLTLATIAVSISLWIFVYRKLGIWNRMKTWHVFPLALWIIFGTLDITITARGTLFNPAIEGNPATRAFIYNYGMLGAPIASILWISLWAAVIAAALKLTSIRHTRTGDFLTRLILYNLAFGHMRGFASWMVATQSLAMQWPLTFPMGNLFVYGIIPTNPLEVLPGFILALLHLVFDQIRSENKKKWPTLRSH